MMVVMMPMGTMVMVLTVLTASIGVMRFHIYLLLWLCTQRILCLSSIRGM